jgi:hypothetical protein
MSDAITAELHCAAVHMRDLHGPGHPRHGFWAAVADWLDERAAYYGELAATTPYGAAGAAFVAGDAGGDPDPALTVARAYLAAGNNWAEWLEAGRMIHDHRCYCWDCDLIFDVDWPVFVVHANAGHSITGNAWLEAGRMRGPAGYGRYDNDPGHAGCPRAKSGMTPCIARDGHLALGGEPPADCVACRARPGDLLAELARDYEPAREALHPADPGDAADLLAALVRRATEPIGPGDDPLDGPDAGLILEAHDLAERNYDL